jgi:hypothetical protein
MAVRTSSARRVGIPPRREVDRAREAELLAEHEGFAAVRKAAMKSVRKARSKRKRAA